MKIDAYFLIVMMTASIPYMVGHGYFLSSVLASSLIFIYSYWVHKYITPYNRRLTLRQDAFLFIGKTVETDLHVELIAESLPKWMKKELKNAEQDNVFYVCEHLSSFFPYGFYDLFAFLLKQYEEGKTEFVDFKKYITEIISPEYEKNRKSAVLRKENAKNMLKTWLVIFAVIYAMKFSFPGFFSYWKNLGSGYVPTVLLMIMILISVHENIKRNYPLT